MPALLVFPIFAFNFSIHLYLFPELAELEFVLAANKLAILYF